MKKQWKGFLLGLIVATLVYTLGVPALAATIKQINVAYSDIKITLNGQEIIPRDANGRIVEPFSVDGTIYLPIRAISETMGLNVTWDRVMNTVILFSPNDTVRPQPTPEPTISVNSSEILLSNGNYIAGDDFPAGTYDVVAVSGRGNVISDNFLDGGINAMIGAINDEFSEYYSREYKNIKFEFGTKLQIIGAIGEFSIKLVPKA